MIKLKKICESFIESDKLKGGKADNIEQINGIAVEELKKGLQTELEHTSDPTIALEICLDHLLGENPNYYSDMEACGLE